MLLLVLTACVPPVFLGVLVIIGWLAGVPLLPMVLTVLGLFAVLFPVCTILAFRIGAKPDHTKPYRAEKATSSPVVTHRNGGNSSARKVGQGRRQLSEPGHDG